MNDERENAPLLLLIFNSQVVDSTCLSLSFRQSSSRLLTITIYLIHLLTGAPGNGAAQVGHLKKHTLFIDTTLRDYSISYYTNIWHFWITYTHYTLLSPITGEHVTGLYSQRDGKLTPLKADLDILNVKEDDVIVIEIKDWQSRLFCKKMFL